MQVTEIETLERVPKHASWTKAGPVYSTLPDREIAALEDRATATIAEPGALGLWAFATATWIVATVFAGNLPLTAMGQTVAVLLLFGGIAQFIAGLYAFRRADALMATAFTCFGSFNAVTGLAFLFTAAKSFAVATHFDVYLGFLLESFAFIALALFFAALNRNLATAAFLGLLCAGYCLTGIECLAGSIGVGGWGVVGAAGGYILMASAFVAYYTGAALVVNSTWRRTLLPLFGEP